MEKSKLVQKVGKAIMLPLLAVGLGHAPQAYGQSQGISLPGTDYKAEDEMALMVLNADADVIMKRSEIQTTYNDNITTEKTVHVDNSVVDKMSPLEFYYFKTGVLDGICKKISPNDKVISDQEAQALFNQLAQIKAYQYNGQ